MVWEGVRLEEVGARRQSQDPVTWQSLRPPAAIHGNLKNVPTPTSSENAEAYSVTRYSSNKRGEGSQLHNLGMFMAIPHLEEQHPLKISFSQ